MMNRNGHISFILLSTILPACGIADADSITIDGIRHEDVLIYKSSSRYHVRNPETAETFSIPMNEIAESDVEINSDPEYREKLRGKYQQAKWQRKRDGTWQEKPSRFDESIRRDFVDGQLVITNRKPESMRYENPRPIFRRNSTGTPVITNLPENYEDDDAFTELSLGLKLVEVPERFRSLNSLYRARRPKTAPRGPIPEYSGGYSGDSRKDIREVVTYYANHYQVDEHLVLAVIRAESAFNANAVSHAGARGLMQLMPSTARAMGVGDIFDPAENIAGGTQYLRKMTDIFGAEELALAAYNSGPGNVKKYRGIPPFKETQAYVPRVLRYKSEYDRHTPGAVRLAEARPVRRSWLPPGGVNGNRRVEEKKLYKIHFQNGLTQLADRYREGDTFYLLGYGGRMSNVDKQGVLRIESLNEVGG